MEVEFKERCIFLFCFSFFSLADLVNGDDIYQKVEWKRLELCLGWMDYSVFQVD